MPHAVSFERKPGTRSTQSSHFPFVEANPAIQSNRCFTFLAKGARPTGQTGFDARRRIELALVPASRLCDVLDGGQVTRSLAECALEAYARRAAASAPSTAIENLLLSWRPRKTPRSSTSPGGFAPDSPGRTSPILTIFRSSMTRTGTMRTGSSPACEACSPRCAPSDVKDGDDDERKEEERVKSPFETLRSMRDELVRKAKEDEAAGTAPKPARTAR